jgi:hypothetical protein
MSSLMNHPPKVQRWCGQIFPCSGTELDSDAQQMNAWDRVGRADFGIVSAGARGKNPRSMWSSPKMVIFLGYPLVNFHITMKITMFNGKTHYKLSFSIAM